MEHQCIGPSGVVTFTGTLLQCQKYRLECGCESVWSIEAEADEELNDARIDDERGS